MSLHARTALALALMGLALPDVALAHQGPDQGSPFVDAPLPFEALKAAPDSSFDILVASLGVFLLVPITAAAFMALARLRNMEASLRKELEQLRSAVAAGASGAGDPPGAAGEDVAAALESVARALEATGQGASGGDADRIVGALDELREAHATSARETAARIQEALAALAAAAARGGVEAGGLAPLDAARAHVEALGYTDVRIVTPADELTAELLSGGSVTVEARRDGSTVKGKVLFADGAPSDVQLQHGHGMFP